tara:strand:- start:10134 stop:11621 length:1488 start_codon:yes stop_codon:yes gene_type:complete
MANNLDNIANILSEASDIYFKSKALDLAAEQQKTAQINIEIDRELAEERYEKQLAVKVLDSQLKTSQDQLKSLMSEQDKARLSYQNLTGDLYKIPEANRTSSSLDITNEMKRGSIDMLASEVNRVNSRIADVTNTRNNILSRIYEIRDMQEYTKGGASGFKGGEDPSVYDPGDFSYEGYLEDTGVADKPWLKKAYKPPTPSDIATLNKSLIDIDYKKSYIRAKTDVDVTNAQDKWLKSTYLETQKSPEGFAMFNIYSRNLVDAQDDVVEKRKAENVLRAEKQRIASWIDPVGLEQVINRIQDDGITMDLIKRYNQGETKFKELSKKGKALLARSAEVYNRHIDSSFNKAYKAVTKMSGSKGVSGTGEDLLQLIRQKVAQYNNINDPDEKEEFAYKVREITGIDVSKQSDIEQLEMVVFNEGFIGIKDPSLRSVITKSKDADSFKSSTDYNVLRSAFLESNDDPDNLEKREAVQFLINDLSPKWGRMEILDSIGEW